MSAIGLYRVVTDAIGVVAPWYLRRRARAGKEDPERLGERFGRAGSGRPTGPLVWVHAASVGESLTLLPVLDRLRLARPDVAVLMTTGTVTSARLMASRLPDGVRHQFVPIDTRAAVGRFLDHWRPDLALVVESELWPNLVLETAGRNIPLILLNGRLSVGSFRRWNAWPHLGRMLFRHFALVLAQDDAQAARFEALGAGRVDVAGDLKAAVAPPPADAAVLERLRSAIGARPVWLAASTHPGEEAIVIAEHQALRIKYPALLTLIAPRHPKRGDAVAALVEAAGLVCRRRSCGDVPDGPTGVYLIDTLGELGVFYRLAPIVLVAGSLGADAAVGGHNPLEAAALGCAVLHGPDSANSAAVTKALDDAGGALRVDGSAGLSEAVDGLLADPGRVAALGLAGRAVAAAQAGVIDRVMDALEPWLGRL
jgi:3-deoxy-D-manno-octulosonic-acid transferase